MPRHPDLPCAGCGRLLWSSSTSLPLGQATCRACRLGARPVAPSRCAFCGLEYAAVWRSDGWWTECCSKSCAQKLRVVRSGKALGRDPETRRASNQAKNRRRRARLYAVETEPYSLEQIAVRDGLRCGLCRKRVDLSLRRPHPRSASIDHIVPLSRGGDDTRSNVQLAHLTCNIRKGNAAEYVQPLLIG